MKSIITILFTICLGFTIGYSQDAQIVEAVQTTDLTVQVTGIKNDEGKMMVALYGTPDTWLNSMIKGEESVIVDGQATVIFKDVPYGIYAISSFHDIDSDGELKSGLFGIPKEPYASSRGAKGVFGPPKWSDAKFTLDKAQVTEVIKY